MRVSFDVRVVCLLTLLFAASHPLAAQQAASLPSETPEKLEPVTDSFDYVKRDVMIPMRDGVKLHTVIVDSKGREECAHPADPHSLQRESADQSRARVRILARS